MESRRHRESCRVYQLLHQYGHLLPNDVFNELRCEIGNFEEQFEALREALDGVLRTIAYAGVGGTASYFQLTKGSAEAIEKAHNILKASNPASEPS